MSELSERFKEFISQYDGATDTSGADLYADFPILYEAFYSKHYNYASLVDLIEEYTELTEDSLIVEGACGTGHLLSQLEENGYEKIVGFDLEPAMLSTANENTNATLFHSNLTEFFIPDRIDCMLVLGNSLFHLNKEERQQFFMQAYENMSNRSTIIFSYMDANEIVDGYSDADTYNIGNWKIRRNSILVDEGGEDVSVSFSFRVSNQDDRVQLQTGVLLDGHAHHPKEIEAELNNAGFSNITITKPEEHNHTITIARKVS